jgi:hypothetical protein
MEYGEVGLSSMEIVGNTRVTTRVAYVNVILELVIDSLLIDVSPQPLNARRRVDYYSAAGH